MPWKESNLMDERVRFVGRLLEGEKMAALCREFGISRKTGYKLFNRFKSLGLRGLEDQSRRPYRHANKLPFQVERTIVGIKKEFSNWGAAKIREHILRQFPDIKAPAKSTVHAVLERHGLVKRRQRKRYKAQGTPLKHVKQPNQLWCADYKGEFLMGNQQYCYPLTITDYASRYLLACEALESTKTPHAFEVFEQAFDTYGLPEAIRTDNGLPFASPNALFGLSKLSVWWLRLGIRIERIKPGHPEQNGRHERMHLTLKQETTKPPKYNLLQQQERFESFIKYFNEQRPHQGINMHYPGELYTPSGQMYRQPEVPTYPYDDKTIRVTQCGRICIGGRKISLSTVLAGQFIGVKEVEDQIWLVRFMDYELGFFDDTADRVEPGPDPFTLKKVLPMSPV